MSVELGELTPLEPPAVEGLEIARHLAISPDGKHVYVVRAMPKAGGTPPESSIGQYARNPSGTLSSLEPYEVLVPSWPPEGPVVVSGDGRHVYVASGGGVFQYARDQETGQLTPLTPRLVEGLKIGGIENSEKVEQVFAMALSPDGLNLYVLHFLNRDVIHQFSRNPETGILKLLSPPEVEVKASSRSGFYFGEGIVVSPDGANAYTVGLSGFSQFRRDAITGQLAEFGFFAPGSVVGDQYLSELAGAGLVISPDGRDIYLLKKAMIHLRRDSRGAITTRYPSEWLPIEGFGFAEAIAISPDGLNLYTAAGGFGTYSRDVTTGELQGIDESPFVGGYQIITSPDGTNVYVANGGNIHQLARATEAIEEAAEESATKITVGLPMSGSVVA